MRVVEAFLAGLALLAASLIMAPAASADSGHRTVHDDYLAGTEPLVETRCEGPLSTTGACFAVHPHDRWVMLTVDDARTDTTAARYSFVGPGGIVHDTDTFCGWTFLFVPSLEDDAPVDRLRVTPIATGTLSADCTGGPGTTGVVTASFVPSSDAD